MAQVSSSRWISSSSPAKAGGHEAWTVESEAMKQDCGNPTRSGKAATLIRLERSAGKSIVPTLTGKASPPTGSPPGAEVKLRFIANGRAKNGRVELVNR